MQTVADIVQHIEKVQKDADTLGSQTLAISLS